MPSPMVDADDDEIDRRAVRWLRILKLLLSVILTAIAIWRAIVSGAPV